MPTYATLDYLPDLTYGEMQGARYLAFTNSTSNSVGWDYTASTYGNESYAILHSIYRFTAVAGATYDISSLSYFDPYLLKIFDSQGNVIQANSESDDPADFFLTDGYYSLDVIWDWVAPYTGTYYVNASWNQGSYYKFYSLQLNEDIDTAGPVDTTIPTVTITDNLTGTANRSTSSVTYSLAFSETVTGLVASDFTLTNGTISSVSGSGSAWSVNVTPAMEVASGSIGLTLKAGAVSDLAGNLNAVAVNTSQAIDTLAPTATFTPADEAIGVPIASDIVVTFSEAIVKGIGNITLKTADGATVATYDLATSPNLSILGNTLTINPTNNLGIFTNYAVELGAGAINDIAGNSFAGRSDYSVTTETMDGLYHFCVVAFSAAPGVGYMNQLATAFNAGMTVKDIVNVFTTKPEFTSTYSESLNNEQLATLLVTNVVKDSASDTAKAEAIVDIVGALDAGWTRGDVIYQVFGNLAHMPLNEAKWGETAHQFNNQTVVARYFTEVMHNNTTDMAMLRAVVGDVTPYTDVSTPEIVATLIGVELAGMV